MLTQALSRRPAAAALFAVVLASGCGTGLHARTYQEQGREDGAAANVGGSNGIAVRNLHLEQTGGFVLVTGGLVNNGNQPDTLLGATTDAASGVDLTVDGSSVPSVDIPPLGAAPQGWALDLSGLTSQLTPATYIGVTLEFAHAGRITLQVPVSPGDTGLAQRTPEQDPNGEG